jgi:hypothetical protein
MGAQNEEKISREKKKKKERPSIKEKEKNKYSMNNGTLFSIYKKKKRKKKDYLLASRWLEIVL